MKHNRGMILSMAVFFLCGFSTVLNVILIPYLQGVLHLQHTPVALVQVSFYFAYFLISPLAGYFFQQRSLLEGIQLGLCIGAVGEILLYFASVYLFFPCILLGVFVIGSGIAILQVTANPYTMTLDLDGTASSRLTWAQAFTSLGMILAPFVGSICILGSHLYLEHLYFSLSAVWIGALIFASLADLPVGRQEQVERTSPLGEKIVIMGILGVTLAIGTEVSLSTFLAKFLADVNIADISLALAGKLMMVFWFGFFVGRVMGSHWLKKIRPEQLLFYHGVAGCVFSVFAIIFSGYFSALSVLFLGFCVSVMFPVIYSMVLESCQSEKSVVSGYLCMANIGGAILPLFQGLAADHIGLHRSFLVPLVGFALLTAGVRGRVIGVMRIADN